MYRSVSTQSLHLFVSGMKDINLLPMIRYGTTIIFVCHWGEVAVASIPSCPATY